MKEYYSAKYQDWNILFKPVRDIYADRFTLRWAWGSKTTPNFILDKLVSLHWLDNGVSIYNDFNNALLEVSEDSIGNTNKGVLVLYSKDVNQNWKFESPEGVHTREQESI